ncbi:alpha/beta hydrolase [Streptomyces armeniacus]|uniref:Alpha/beta hydrolase n=1 Tax=Streptomyces armeniacus TaxID=83291 RepID=A0A345XWM9_9ACTN|nr:alpha/beta hydrolase [Streptomyces armeniacus]AXK36045.1 alpha/beta hydrolase [Streptomyces armeniacus]
MTRLTSTGVRTVPTALTPPEPRSRPVVVSADGARLHVEVHGPAAAPAVVLVHGWTCSTVFWAPVLRALVADGHRVITYDLRGHGRTPAAVPRDYGTRLLADDLCAVLDATLAPGERAVLGGHSMGAMTLMAAAGRPQLREHAAALMLCSTGAARLVPEARVVPVRPAALRTWIQRKLLGTSAPLGPVTPVSRRILRYGTMGSGSTRDQTDMCARIVHACPRKIRAAWAHVLDGLDLSDGLSRLTHPTAVVAGTADRLTPIAHARGMAAALPHCTGLTELPGRGHMTPVEAPDVVSGVLTGLVRDHLTGTGTVAGTGTATFTTGDGATGDGATGDAAGEAHQIPRARKQPQPDRTAGQFAIKEETS